MRDHPPSWVTVRPPSPAHGSRPSSFPTGRIDRFPIALLVTLQVGSLGLSLIHHQTWPRPSPAHAESRTISARSGFSRSSVSVSPTRYASTVDASLVVLAGAAAGILVWWMANALVGSGKKVPGRSRTRRDSSRRARLEEIRPECPRCRRPAMSVAFDGRWSWECRAYPACRGTLAMSDDALALLLNPNAPEHDSR